MQLSHACVRRPVVFALAIGLLCAHSLSARQADHESAQTKTETTDRTGSIALDRLLIEISTHHPVVRSMALRAAAERDMATAADWSYPDPTLGVVWSNIPYKQDLRIERDRTPMSGIEVQLSQPIPFPGRLSTEAGLADIAARATLLQLSIAKNNLSLGFLEDASHAAVLDQLHRLTENYSARFRLVASSARTRYSVGRGSLADVSQAELTAGQFAERARRFRGQRDARLAMLNYYWPQSNGDARTHQQWIAGLHGESAEQWQEYRQQIVREIKANPQLLLDRAPGVRLVALQRKAAREEQNLARFAYLPDFEVFAAYRQRERVEDDPAIGEDFYSFGMRMRVPLWSALGAGSQVSASAQRADAAQLEHSSAIDRLRARIAALQSELASAEDRLQSYEGQLIPRAKRARDSAQLAYRTGRADFTTLLGTWQSLFAQESERIRLLGERDRIAFTMAALLNIIIPEASDANDNANQ